MEISKEQFLDYERIRESGRTNMFDVKMVSALSYTNLNKDEILHIMKNYSELKEEYLE